MLHTDKAVDLLKVHEGYRQYPYDCTEGLNTIGYYGNLESRGLTEIEASYLLHCDVKLAESELMDQYEYYWSLSPNRKVVLINMMVNLGSTRLRGFKNMHRAIEDRDYVKASLEMLDSRWADQVGQRALTLSEIMLNNKIEVIK